MLYIIERQMATRRSTFGVLGCLSVGEILPRTGTGSVAENEGTNMSEYSIPYVMGGCIEAFTIAFMIYGVTMSQANFYMQRCDRDPSWMKWLAVLAIVNPSSLGVIDWGVPVSIVLDLIIETATEGFYIHRLWTYSKNIYLTAGVLVLLASRIAGLIYETIGTEVPTWAIFESRNSLRAVFIFTMSASILLDGILAAGMVYYLRRGRKEAQIKRTRDIVRWLMVYAVNTGGTLVAMTIVVLVTYLAVPGSLMFAGMFNILTKLYANSLFGALNSKHNLREKMKNPVILGSGEFESAASDSYRMRELRVRVATETSKAFDQLEPMGADEADEAPSRIHQNDKTVSVA
ncbi:unnamed protein product [Somion occarium]